MLATLVAWFGNTLVLVGVLYLAVEVYLTKQLARMRHVESGQPIPANNFFMQMGNFFARAFGLWPDFNPLGTSARFKLWNFNSYSRCSSDLRVPA